MNFYDRFYRSNLHTDKLKSFRACVLETDLFILADTDLTDLAVQLIFKYRGYIESYIKEHPSFLYSLVPIINDNYAHPIVKDMILAARFANVGPMASVAGAIAEFVGNDLLQSSKNIIVENGGDIFLKTNFEVKVGVFAGDSPLSDRINIIIKPDDMPVAVCTSSGTIGHSLSFGKADAVCVVARSASLADAAATAICNLVKTKKDVNNALEFGFNIQGVSGILIVIDDTLGLRGKIEIA